MKDRMSFKTYVDPNSIVLSAQKEEDIYSEYKHQPQHFSFGRYFEDEEYRKYFDETDFTEFYREQSRIENMLKRNNLQSRRARSRGKQIKTFEFESSEAKVSKATKTKANNAMIQFGLKMEEIINEIKVHVTIRGEKKLLTKWIDEYKSTPLFVYTVERNADFELAKKLFTAQYKDNFKDASEKHKNFNKASKTVVRSVLGKNGAQRAANDWVNRKPTHFSRGKDTKEEKYIRNKIKNGKNKGNKLWDKAHTYLKDIHIPRTVTGKKLRRIMTQIIESIRRHVGWIIKVNGFKQEDFNKSLEDTQTKQKKVLKMFQHKDTTLKAANKFNKFRRKETKGHFLEEDVPDFQHSEGWMRNATGKAWSATKFIGKKLIQLIRFVFAVASVLISVALYVAGAVLFFLLFLVKCISTFTMFLLMWGSNGWDTGKEEFKSWWSAEKHDDDDEKNDKRTHSGTILYDIFKDNQGPWFEYTDKIFRGIAGINTENKRWDHRHTHKEEGVNMDGFD